jgi:hypothetical protein
MSEVLLGAQSMVLCDASGVPTAASVPSLHPQVALPEYPLWYDTAVTSRWFAAPRQAAARRRARALLLAGRRRAYSRRASVNLRGYPQRLA